MGGTIVMGRDEFYRDVINSFTFAREGKKSLGLSHPEFYWLQYFISNEKEWAVSLAELEQKSGDSLSTIKRSLKTLKEKNLIKWIHGDKFKNIYSVSFLNLKQIIQDNTVEQAQSELPTKPCANIAVEQAQSDPLAAVEQAQKRTPTKPEFGLPLPYKRNKERNNNIKKQEKISVFKDLIDYWNSKKIIVHNPTKELVETISKLATKKRMPLEALKIGIDRFAEVYLGNQYYWSHKWSLSEFLGRKNAHAFFIEEFLFEKYLKKQPIANNKAQQKQDELDKVYLELMGDNQCKVDNYIEVDFTKGEK